MAIAAYGQSWPRWINYRIIESLLSEAGISAPIGLDSATISTFDQNPSDTELDIVISSNKKIICVEIKTSGQLGEDQRDRQVTYLKDVIEEDENRDDGPFDTWEYVYLAADSDHNPDFAQHQLTWKELLDSITPHVGAVDRDTDAIRLREWIRFARLQFTDSEGVAPAAELQLAYPQLVDEYNIDLDQAAVETSRQRILSSYWEWLQDVYPAIAKEEEGWEDSRSRVESRTKYIRLSKEMWPDEMRFEVQATKKRMTADSNHSSDNNSYRTPDPHIEMTLTYSNVDTEERNRLLAHLSTDEEEILSAGGFGLIRDALPADCDAGINPYHVYSKQVPIDFSNPEVTVDGLKEGMNHLMQLKETLEAFEKQQNHTRAVAAMQRYFLHLLFIQTRAHDMSAARLSARVKGVVIRSIQDFGKVLLFFVLLTSGFLVSVLGGMLFFGSQLTPESALSIQMETGARTATQLLKSFTDRQSQLVFSIWVVALCMGVATLWVYQQTVAKFEDLRRWMRTTRYR